MPDPILSEVSGFFDYKFHQVAIITNDIAKAVLAYEDLGYNEWIFDDAVLKGYLAGDPVVTRAAMAFNYDIMPNMELEFLEYSGPSRHKSRLRLTSEPFISHMSVYVDDVIYETRALTDQLHRAPFHRFVTQQHTNPGVAGKKRFIESIFDMRDTLGYDLKLIQKVPHDYNDDTWLDEEF